MPPALRFERYARNLWRVIEGQYRPATLKIVDTLAEQARLEALLEASKPNIPEACRHLDYQFSAPFRYGRYPGPSRFRRAGRTPGVWYASETALTAALESAWRAVGFYRASPATPIPQGPRQFTAILADIRSDAALDLGAPDMAALGNWGDPVDYADCLDLADTARAAMCEVIRYPSVRDPDRGMNAAVLTCAAFAQPAPIQTQSWHMLLRRDRLHLYCETLRQSHEYIPGAQEFARG